MAYDPVLADRVRKILNKESIVEKKMFGGIGYLINGNMACGVHGENLIVRVGTDRHAELLARPSAKPFDLTGTAMAGWLEVIPAGTKDETELAEWVHLGLEFAQTLPVKSI